jgi:hypothetical protein
LKLRTLLSVAICIVSSLPAAFATNPATAEKPAENLYLQLGEVGLDPSRVYLVRGASLSRGGIQISLEDGTIAFTQDVMGQITGAFFEGEGEVLLSPPNEVERRSLSLFTGMAILEERFATAYFRFNDDVPSELKPDLRNAEDTNEFIVRWKETTKNLASGDAMRLLLTLSENLPTKSSSTEAPGTTNRKSDRFLHARLQGTKLGVFDVFFDSTAGEQVFAGQMKSGTNGDTYYDVWTSFSPTTPAAARQIQSEHSEQEEGASAHNDRVALQKFAITTEVLPPKEIRARAVVQCEVREGGARTLLFELSRFLQVESVQLNGEPVEFIHNPALEGTQLSRRGNDIMAVVMPQPLRTGQKFELTFVYAGEVLAQAGDGLLYVGARGTWYPNRGLEMAAFDLQFSYPQGWTLVATGKQAPFATESIASTSGEQTSRWISDRLIPVAGFNLGRYREATTKVGDVEVETYATQGVERDFPKEAIQVVEPPPRLTPTNPTPQLVLPSQPTPALNEVLVGQTAARAVRYFSDRFGPFPYSHLALTQLPGRESQGWPGLIFLSSYAFLDQQAREQLHYSRPRMLLVESVPAHETAHQWWGDLVIWSSYRDQWYSEGLANYCALMMVQEKSPESFRQIMDMYRRELVEKNKDGVAPMDAGPVTLGTRLLSSHFPRGYEAISYGRGAWLFHMLRTMLNDAAKQEKKSGGTGTDELFVRSLRKVRQRYEGKMISTRELLDVFAEDLPPALRYEGKKSLDWFLDGWVNGSALPTLELKGVKFTPKESGVIVNGTILQKDAPVELVTSVPIYGQMGGKQLVLLGRVFADGEESSFRLSAPAGVHKIVVDPYETVLTRPK